MAKHSLVWLHAVDSLVRLELDAADRFFRFSELRFLRELEKLKREEKSHPKSYWREELDFGTTRGDLLGDEAAEVREMQRLNRYFGIILVYAALEKFLLAIFRSGKELKLIKDSRTAAKSSLDFKGYVQVLKKDMGIDLIKRSKEYAALNKLRAIRNAIAHQGGRVNSENASSLRPHGFEKHQHIALDEDYFFEVEDLVKRECLLISNSYRNFVRGKKLA